MVGRVLWCLLAVAWVAAMGAAMLSFASVAGAAPDSSSGTSNASSSRSGTSSPTTPKSTADRNSANAPTSPRHIHRFASTAPADSKQSTSVSPSPLDRSASSTSAGGRAPHDTTEPTDGPATVGHSGDTFAPTSSDATPSLAVSKNVAGRLQIRQMPPASLTSTAVAREATATSAPGVAAITKAATLSQPTNVAKPALTADSREAVTDSALTTAAVATSPGSAPMSAISAAFSPATVAASPAPKPATVIDLIGTVVFDVLNAGLSLSVGAPVLPAGSTVTVRVSALQLPCSSSACSVTADWYFPDDPNPTGLIYLQHGILANAAMYSYTAAALAEQTNSIVVAPTITSNFFATDAYWLGGAPMQQAVADLFVGDRAALTASASAAAGYQVVLPQRVVLVGHSLGGSLVAAAARDMVDNGSINSLAGVVLLDGVSLDPTLISTTVAKVPNSLPILLIASPPYWLNQLGNLANELVSARPGQFDGVEMVGGSHIDAMQGGNPLIQLGAYVVGGFSQPQNIAAYTTLESGWINDMFNGTHTGIYGVPGQTLQIPTTAGTATAIGLPAPPTTPSPIDVFLNAILGFASTTFFNLVPTSGTAVL